MGQDISLKSERKNPWFKPWFNIFCAHNCVCHSIRSMFRVLGMYNFALHLKTRQPVLPYCKAIFSTEESWLNHQSGAHSEQITCETCNKTYASVYELNRHVKEIHTKAKSFQCSLCDATFSRKYNCKGWRTFQPWTFQPQASTPDLSTPEFSTINFSTPK